MDRPDAMVTADSSTGDDAPAVLDPGRPSSEFGAKCYVELTEDATNTTVAIEECAAPTVSSADGSHIFFTIRRLPTSLQRFYVSMIVGSTPITAGAHSAAKAGAIEATLTDGRKFSVGDIKQTDSFQLVVEKAVSMMPDVFYLTGTLDATLVDVTNPASKLKLRTWINRPITP